MSEDVNTAPIAVFDLDGTLVRGQSFTLFVHSLLRREWWRGVLALLSSPVLLPLLLSDRTKHLWASGYLWIGTVGIPGAQLDSLLDSFVAQHCDAKSGNIVQGSLGAARQHLEDGSRVVVATACFTPLAARLCASIELAPVELVASPIRRRLGGWVVPSWFSGTVKTRALRESDIEGPFDHAYSDDAGDVSILLSARHPVLVAPSRFTRLRMARRVKGLTVLDD